MPFSNAQLEAINHRDGPMLVLAGPGSGKTTVITERVRVLTDSGYAAPQNILVVTFTKAAAIEMQERFLKSRGGAASPVRFGTFHSVFFMILKHAYHYDSRSVLPEGQKKQFLTEIFSRLGLQVQDEAEFLAQIAGEISMVKSEKIPLSNYYPINCSQEVFAGFYQSYEERLRREGLLDFDDMLIYCQELLTKRPDILSLWQQQFSYILVDEFQDINKIQYDIIKLLAGTKENLFIVGDDDQSIYRFRGARPELMLHFEKDFPRAKRVVLDINYRSAQTITQAAQRVVQNNKARFPKQIRAAHAGGSPVTVRRFPDLAGENRRLVEEIGRLKRQDYDYSDIAVLFRTNVQPRALIGKLMEYNIPFLMKDAVPNVYEHFIARDMVSYIRLAMGLRDRGLFLRIINRPKRYISRECLDTELVDLERLRMYYEDKRWMIERIDKLEYDLKLLAGMPPYAALNYIINGIGYGEFLREYADLRNMDENELFDVLDEIRELSREFTAFEEWFAHMKQYGEELKKQNRQGNRESRDAVTMATLHGAKGLEFRAVFLIDANEGIMPYKKAVLDVDMEEERRMFYVGMTRAKEQLFIYLVKQRYNRELCPSRFLSEMGAQPPPA